jgi:transcription elongation factor GreA
MATTFLTQEGYQKLLEDLDVLRTQKREEIAQRLHEALDGGELIENAEYEAAKNEQAFVEGRIEELDILLATARIIPDSIPVDQIQVGSKVTIQEEDLEPETYIIVGVAEANPAEGRISNESPLGKALINHKKDEILGVDAPGGHFDVKVLKVE